MVDQSKLAWRLLVKRNGVDLAYSEMMHARMFKEDKKYRQSCIDWDDYSHISGNKEIENISKLQDQPLIVQLAGDDPDTVVEAGRYLHHNVAAIDLNLGCPQKIAKRGNYGAYLLSQPDQVIKVLKAMVKGLDCPITAKVRRLATDEATIELCQRIEATGVQLLTIHGRTVDNSKLYIGPCDWDIIKKVKETLRIPVIANGGISSRSDAIRCLEYTGADGVMSSEALLENPKLFSIDGDMNFKENYVKSQLDIASEYIDIVTSYKAPKSIFANVRGHLFKILFRFINVESNSDLRYLLAEGNLEEMISVVYKLKERFSTIDYNTEIAEERGMISKSSWYLRHRNEESTRIISPRRRDRLRPELSNTIEDNTSTLTLEEKLSKLKLKLSTKKSITKNL
jgi:tRNA-dihydrouridine synthase